MPVKHAPRRGPRRARGSGGLSLRKDGIWVGSVQIGYEKGRRIRMTVGAKLKEDAAKKLIALQAAHNEGKNIAGSSQTVADYLDAWLERRKVMNPNSYDFLRLKVQNMLKPHLRDTKLRSLTYEMVDHLINTTLVKAKTQRTGRVGYSPESRKHARDVLRNAINDAVRSDTLQRNVVRLVKIRGLVDFKPYFLDKEQADELLRTARRERYQDFGALFELAVMTGMRQGELLGMRWEHLNLAKRQYNVREQLQRERGANTPGAAKNPQDGENLKLVELKTNKSSYRTIELPHSCVVALQKQRERHAVRRRMDKNWNPRGLIFPAPSGIALQPSRLVHEYFRPMCAESGIPFSRRWDDGAKRGLNFHGLRHTAATLMLMAEIQPTVIKNTLGWSTIAMVDRYTHLLPAMTRQGADAMEKFFATP